MKILLLTHNPICTTNNMGKTFLSLFSGFEKDQICQLYIHPSIPDINVCSSYFQITDLQVLRSLPFSFPGSEVKESLIQKAIADRENGISVIPPPRGGATAHIRILRDMMWKISRWYSPELKRWIDSEKPTCIFLAPGYAKFIYDIALKISRDYGIPIVSYICDDYYFVENPRSILSRFQLILLKKKTRELMQKTKKLVVISQELREKYEKHFKVPTEVIMTGADMAHASMLPSKNNFKYIRYFGNLSAGRNVSLANIGQALDDINAAHGSHIALEIYTSETTKELLNVFDGIKSAKLCGFISGSLLQNAFSSTDMLIHTESFDDINIDLVKHSVSTKIADSLASRIPLFAYGPDSISSMKHLIRNNCAIIATSKDQLKPALEKALFNRDIRQDVVNNAIKTASEFHDKQKNSNRLRSIFLELEGTTNE